MALRWHLFTIPYLTLFLIAFIPIFLVFFIGIHVINIPNAIFHSFKRSMPDSMEPVQLYITRFEALHPDLISFVAQLHNRLSRGRPRTNATSRQVAMGPPRNINWWPSKSKVRDLVILPVGGVHSKDYQFSPAAGLFAHLQDAGWSLEVLYAFLRDSVERSGRVTQQEKEAFAATTEKLCSYSNALSNSFVESSQRSFQRCMLPLTEWTKHKETSTLRDWGGVQLPSEMRMVHVNMESVDWILQRGGNHGVLLVPENALTLQCMNRLSRLFPMWGRVNTAGDLNANFSDFWQVMVTC